MIRTAVKLALVAIVANATWHLFLVYSANYKFKDSVQSAAQYRGKKSDEELRQQILEIAAEAELPIDPAQLAVTQDGAHTLVDTSYTRVVELFPGLTRPWSFDVHVDATTAEPVSIPLSRPK